jgi:hypothetical protein
MVTEPNISTRIDEATYAELKRKADKENRSLANYIRNELKKLAWDKNNH